MEFFLELALTISLPLLLSYFIAKLISKDPINEELSSFGFDFQFTSRVRDPIVDKTRIVVEDLINDDDDDDDDEIDHLSEQCYPIIVESRDETESKCDITVMEEEDEEEVEGEGEEEEEEEEEEEGFNNKEKVFDESSVRVKNEESGEIQDEKVVVEDGVCDESQGFDVVNEGKSLEEVIGGDDDDDWEGIERSELEKTFDAAVECVALNEAKNSNFDNELKMQLFGLHKVATEGSCREPPPMALKISARAKWNAWKQLGNITPEEAMESYINMVSENIPGWTPKSPTPTVNNELDATHTCESGTLVTDTKPQQ